MRRPANGSANGDTRVPTRLARMTGLLRLMRRRSGSGKRVQRDRAMVGESGRRRLDGTRDYSGRMSGSIGRIMVGSDWQGLGLLRWHCIAWRWGFENHMAGVLWTGHRYGKSGWLPSCETLRD